MTMNIAVIGCGAIGASVLELLKGHAAVQVGWVLVPEVTDAVRATLARHAPQARALPALTIEDRPDLIVECAGHTAIEEHVLPALRRGIPAVVASIGALSAPGMAEAVQARSEEHTSELQSQSNLVCRLLLEKKKNDNSHDIRLDRLSVA